LRRRWNQTRATRPLAAGTFQVPFICPLDYSLSPVARSLPPNQSIPSGGVTSPYIVQPAQLYGCSSFRYQCKTLCSPYNLPRRPREGIEIYLYSSFNPETIWGRMVNSTYRQSYPPEKRPAINFTGGPVGPQGRSGRARKVSQKPGFNSRTVQLVDQCFPSFPTSRCP
jgi:hypothetical protein